MNFRESNSPPKTSILSLLMPILFAGLVMASNIACSKNDSSTISQPPKFTKNVIMIVSDALRPDVLGCYGGEAKTPNIDWLAENGIKFENAYSTSPWTVPSSVSMFTGNYPTVYKNAPFAKDHPSGVRNMNLSLQIQVPENEMLLAEYLQKNGYKTLMKVENPHARLHNNLQGFAPLPSTDQYDQTVPADTKQQLITITGEELNDSHPYMDSYIFLSSLLKLKATDTFFALTWMVDPHSPYQPIKKFKKRINTASLDLQREEAFYSETLPANASFSESEKWYNKQLYIAEVESVDERLGFIIKVLRHNNLLENTIIIFTSDHGEEFGEHGQYGHGGFGRGCNYFDTLVKVPLIISGPGLPKQRVVTEPVSHLDLTPTIADILGAQYNNDMQGKSYYPLLKGIQEQPRPIYFCDVRENDQQDAILMDYVKLIARRDGAYELYDLAHDKNELTNIETSTYSGATLMKQAITEHRETNKKRREQNEHITATPQKQSSEEKKETIKKLKDLGYIK